MLHAIYDILWYIPVYKFFLVSNDWGILTSFPTLSDFLQRETNLSEINIFLYGLHYLRLCKYLRKLMLSARNTSAIGKELYMVVSIQLCRMLLADNKIKTHHKITTRTKTTLIYTNIIKKEIEDLLLMNESWKTHTHYCRSQVLQTKSTGV